MRLTQKAVVVADLGCQVIPVNESRTWTTEATPTPLPGAKIVVCGFERNAHHESAVIITRMRWRRRTGLGVEIPKTFGLGLSAGQPGFSLGDEFVDFHYVQRHESLSDRCRVTAVCKAGPGPERRS